MVHGGGSQVSDTISYQIHSFNDLREWKQTVYKGALWFKLGALKDGGFPRVTDESDLQTPTLCPDPSARSSRECQETMKTDALCSLMTIRPRNTPITTQRPIF